MTFLYGISNCDTVKKARKWMDGKGIPFEFVDFKAKPPTEAQIRRWLREVPAEALLNRRGTTWRKLDDAEKAAAETEDGAVRLMLAQPSVIKRPVLEHGGACYCGFSDASYQGIFGK